MKYTPGPWRINKRASGVVEDVNGRVVASCSGYTTNADNGEHIEENHANTHLIAAAPDLLEALKNCVTDAGQLLTQPERLERIKFAQAAIAKTEEVI